MRVSIFGLGYVGAVSAACLARDGHEVTGVDVNREKVERVARGESPIVEPGVAGLLAGGVASGRVSATWDAALAVGQSEVSLITVGTPRDVDGASELRYVERVCSEIGAAIAAKGVPHVVVLRSTVPPGTTERCTASIAAAAGDAHLVHVAFNPEFLREGSAVHDYEHPAYTVVGTSDPVAETAVRGLYSAVCAPFHVVAPAVAELLKYAANAWHATKISFANELGRVAAECGVDPHEVMGLVAADQKLNASAAYLRPGFAYGGSCLPKDVDALVHMARQLGVTAPLLLGVRESNQAHIEAAVCAVLRHGARRVAVLGLAFKPGTDDLRESPAVQLVERLLAAGRDVRVYDECVNEARLLGTNLEYIRSRLPHLEALLADSADDCVDWSEVIVVTHDAHELAAAIARAAGTRPVVDLVGRASQLLPADPARIAPRDACGRDAAPRRS